MKNRYLLIVATLLGLMLISAINIFAQTTVVFTDNSGGLTHEIDDITFTFGAENPGEEPSWDTELRGYRIGAYGSGKNWIEFKLTGVGIITANELQGGQRISLKWSTDDGETWNTWQNAKQNVTIYTLGEVIFRYTTTNANVPVIDQFTFTTLNIATKLELRYKARNLYETDRYLHFRILALGDNDREGTYSNFSMVGANYSVTGTTEVIPPTFAILESGAFNISPFKISAPGNYTITISDTATTSAISPISYNFSISEKSLSVVEWDFISMGIADPAASFVYNPTAAIANNEGVNTFYALDGNNNLRTREGFLRIDTVALNVIDAENYEFTDNGVQTGGFSTRYCSGLKVFVSLDAGTAGPDKIQLSYATDSVNFIPVGNFEVGYNGEIIGSYLDLPQGAENEEKVFLRLSTPLDAKPVEGSKIVGGEIPVLRYYAILITADELNTSISEGKVVQPLFTAYPNPATDILHVNLLKTSDVTLHNLTGQLINSHTKVEGDFEMSLENIKKGVYFLRVVTNGKMHTEKIIVQ